MGLEILNKGRSRMKNTLTAVFEKVAEGYIGYVEELPGVNAQGETLEEVRESLKEAIELVLEANRQLMEEEISGKEFIKEPFGTIST
jgi:predicted RNase H-like HicB family nuclease